MSRSSFAPGEAYQFDWSHEVVLLNGVTVIVKAALRVVDLRRGDSEIEQHAVDLRERKSGKDVGQFRKPGAAENETGIE